MTIIQRHVLLEILKVFFLCLGITVLMMTVGGGVMEGMKRGLPPQVIASMLPYFVPEMLRYTLPGCILFAVCTVFGRMAATNEVVALKSAGISPMEVVWPVLIMTYFLSFFTFWVYDACAAWSRPNMHRIVAQSLDDTAYSLLRTQKSFSMGGFSVNVKAVEGRTLVQPYIHVQASDSEPEITLTAQQARLHTDPETGILQIICRDGRVEMAGEGSFDFPDEFVHNIDQLGSVDVDEDRATPAMLPLSIIPRQIRRERELLESALQHRDDIQNYDASEMHAHVERNIQRHEARVLRLQAERQRRLSNGFGCFCFAMVGIPVAMWWRSSDNLSTFFICFLPILAVYYPLLMAGENMARAGGYGPFPVWIADGVMLLFGIILFKRLNQH